MKKKLLLILLLSFCGKVFSSDFDDKFSSKKWIPEYYNEIVFNQNRDLLLNYIPKYKNQKEILFQRESLLDVCDYWNDEYSETSIIYLLFDSFEVRNIEQVQKDYYEISIVSGTIDNEMYKKALENGCDWKRSNIEIKTLFFKFDGDYLYIFFNDNNNLLTTYCAYEKSEYKSLVKFIQTNNSDISDISLPRHADGSCDYDGSSSNLVKVEVQGGAKDRDGKAIKVGLVGWAYGGYLE